MSNPHIKVWSYYQAPKKLQISDNGGDEDWLAEVPPEFKNEWIRWLERPAFGVCSVDEYEHPTKTDWKIVIGSHA